MDEQKIAEKIAREVRLVDRVAAEVQVGDGVWNTVKGLIGDSRKDVANTGTVSRNTLSSLNLASKALKGFSDRKLFKDAEAVTKAAEQIDIELQKVSNKMIPAFERKLDKLYGQMSSAERK